MKAKLEAFGVVFWRSLCVVAAYLLCIAPASAQTTFDPADFVTEIDPPGQLSAVATAIGPTFGVGLLVLLTGAAVAGVVMWLRRGIKVRG